MVSSMGLGSTGDCSQLMLDETGDSRHATWTVTLSRKSGTVCGLVVKALRKAAKWSAKVRNELVSLAVLVYQGVRVRRVNTCPAARNPGPARHGSVLRRIEPDVLHALRAAAYHHAEDDYQLWLHG